MNQSEFRGYLENIVAYLNLDYTDKAGLMAAIREHEPDNRVQYDAEKDIFQLGMATWKIETLVEQMQLIRDAVMTVLDKVVSNGVIGEKELEQLNKTRHDMFIQYVYDPETPTRLKLNYIVPEGKIAWETGMCPHCRVDVTIHLFPDPMPLIGYEAIINTLRLLTRSTKLKKTAEGEYKLAE